MSLIVGYAGGISRQYLRFKELMTIATVEQLLQLAKSHDNTVVRLYAFQALKYKKAPVPDELTVVFMNDETYVKTIEGCVIGQAKLNALARKKLTVIIQ